MRANLDLTRGGIVAERVAVLLAERLGRQRVARARPGGVAAGGRVRLVARRRARGHGRWLTDDELAAALDPATYLGAAGALVDRALARYAEEGA